MSKVVGALLFCVCVVVFCSQPSQATSPPAPPALAHLHDAVQEAHDEQQLAPVAARHGVERVLADGAERRAQPRLDADRRLVGDLLTGWGGGCVFWGGGGVRVCVRVRGEAVREGVQG